MNIFASVRHGPSQRSEIQNPASTNPKLSSRRNMVSRLGAVCIPCCSALSICGVSQDSTMRKTSTPLTEPDVSISDIRLFNELTDEATGSCRYKGGIGDVRYSVQCPTHVSSSLCVLLPTPSSGLRALAGHYSDYSSTMSWSDCHAAIPPPCLFSACWRLPSRERHGSPKFRCKPLDDLPWT